MDRACVGVVLLRSDNCMRRWRPSACTQLLTVLLFFPVATACAGGSHLHAHNSLQCCSFVPAAFACAGGSHLHGHEGPPAEHGGHPPPAAYVDGLHWGGGPRLQHLHHCKHLLKAVPASSNPLSTGYPVGNIYSIVSTFQKQCLPATLATDCPRGNNTDRQPDWLSIRQTGGQIV